MAAYAGRAPKHFLTHDLPLVRPYLIFNPCYVYDVGG